MDQFFLEYYKHLDKHPAKSTLTRFTEIAIFSEDEGFWECNCPKGL